MPRVLAQLAAPLRRLLGATGPLLSIEAVARELKALYWDLRDASDFLHDTSMTARAHLLARSCAAAANELEGAPGVTAPLISDLRACAVVLSSWPQVLEPFDGLVFEGPLTRETASVVALTSMRRAQACLEARKPEPRPRPSAPIRWRPT